MAIKKVEKGMVPICFPPVFPKWCLGIFAVATLIAGIVLLIYPELLAQIFAIIFILVGLIRLYPVFKKN